METHSKDKIIKVPIWLIWFGVLLFVGFVLDVGNVEYNFWGIVKLLIALSLITLMATFPVRKEGITITY